MSLDLVKFDRSWHVAVLMGGTSAEREVSLKSGAAVVDALKQNDFKVTAIDFDETGLEQLMQINPDVVFNILHGTMGEDGVVQGILEYLKIPYTGSGVIASALTMDKLLTKRILRDEGIATPNFLALSCEDDCRLVKSALGFPVMVKPVYEGSSIGMSIAKTDEELKQSYQLASAYGDVMVEAYITGKEYTVAFLDKDILPIIELQTDNQFYDYEAKYESNDTRYICPCDLDDELAKNIQSLVEKSIAACQVTGWGRVDLMCDKNNQAYVLEINTIPGMTDHSLVPMAAKQAGLSFKQLVNRILKTAVN